MTPLLFPQKGLLMASPRDEFPQEIRVLPLDEGPFPAHRLKAEKCDVLFATYPEGATLEPHRHDDTNIIGVVTQGRVLLTVDGVEAAYGPGDWFHVPPSAEHSAVYETTTMEVEFLFPV